MGETLKGKTAVVTGSSSPKSIGKGIALRLAQEGANVVVNGRSFTEDGRRKADIVVEEIRRNGGTAVANYDSVATPEGAKNVIKTCVDTFGRIDILVNCAGNHIPSDPPLSATEEEFDSMIATHLKGHFECCKATAEEMMKQGDGGCIVNFSSRSAFLTGPAKGKQLLYGTVKAGVIGFSVQLAAALEEYGIRVNCILPDSESEVASGAHIPGGMGDDMPEPVSEFKQKHVAAIVAFLATEQAKKITGKNIYVGGADFCIYGKLLHMNDKNRFFRNESGEPWSFEELAKIDW